MAVADDAALAAVLNAMDPDSGGGRDQGKARQLAGTYVAAHPEEFASYANMSLPECVAAVDVFRQATLNEQVALIECWLLHRFEPQDIGGAANGHIRKGA